MIIQNKKAFTLVELIVVVTILAILSTIWFVSYSWYLASVRDTNRISQLKAIWDWLHLHSTKKSLPLPDSKISITSWTWTDKKTIAYQWYVWKDVIDTIGYTSEWLDPKDNTYFSYYLTRDKKYFQLMAFLEEKQETISVSAKFSPLKWEWLVQAVDYEIRYPHTQWKKLWILTDNKNTPIQDVSSIKTSKEFNTYNVGSNEYKSYLKSNEVITWTWTTFSKLKDIAKVWWKWYSVNWTTLVYKDLGATITNYPWCDTDDITFWTITIAACNVWTNKAARTSDDTEWYWSYFQFGRSDTTWTNSSSSYSYDWKSPGWTDDWSANLWWVSESDKETITYSASTDENKLKMKWPCASWYHVPTTKEWVNLKDVSDITNVATAYSKLKLPVSGYRIYNNGNKTHQGSDGSYWSASPNGVNGNRFYFDSSTIRISEGIARSRGYPVRCFKN